jgi:hypothetical protein
VAAKFNPNPRTVLKLVGETGFELCPELPDAVKTELAWATHLLLTNTVTRTAVVYYQGQVLLRRGILGQNSTVQPGAIVQRVLDKHKPVYLVNLALYPGRFEFDYLPENTQGVICQPIGQKGVLILGANTPAVIPNKMKIGLPALQINWLRLWEEREMGSQKSEVRSW